MSETSTLPNLKRLFHYDASRGELEWKIRSGRAFVGNVAGTQVSGGYRRVLIDKKSYAVHHIVWWLETGEWPLEIDHIDGNKRNNVFSNLRSVTRSENMLNKPLQANNVSGHKGIHYCNLRNRWKVQLRKLGMPTIQRYFDTLEEALEFRKSLERRYYGSTYRSE